MGRDLALGFGIMTPHRRGPRPVCMLTHSNYEEDSRVRREAETLVRAGRPVDVYGLRRRGQGASDVIDGVRLTRLPVERHQGAGIGTYLAEYAEFFARSMMAATRAHRERRYALVQVHTLPDFLVFAGLPLRLAGGVPLLLDLHEAMPDFFRSRFPARTSRAADLVLRTQERLAIAVAGAVLTVNDALRDRLVAQGVPASKVTVILNAPDHLRFDPASQPSRAFMADATLRLIYAGALTPTYELDVVLDALASIVAERPGLPFHAAFYGRGDAEPALRTQADRLGIGDRVRAARSDPDRRRAGSDRRGGHRPGADAAERHDRREPVDEALRVCRDG